MSLSPAKQLYSDFVNKVINRGQTDIIPDLFSPDYVDHADMPGMPEDTFEAIAMIPKFFRGAFPDLHFIIEDMVEEGDWIATRVTGSGTHLGKEFMGIEPTGFRVRWSSMGFFRVENGKIVEHYGQPDFAGLMQQLSREPDPNNEIEMNRFVVTRYVYATNIGDLDRFDEFVSPDFVDHNPIPGQKPGVEGLKDAYRAFSSAFTDIWYTFEALAAEGDTVFGRGVIQGRHTGPFMGVPATGRVITWTGTRTFRVRNGMVTDGWIDFDMLGMLMQTGTIPTLDQMMGGGQG